MPFKSTCTGNACILQCFHYGVASGVKTCVLMINMMTNAVLKWHQPLLLGQSVQRCFRCGVRDRKCEDLIRAQRLKQVGGAAANFLDIGGGANADVMAGALEVINSDETVKSIFINIFGGITRGEEVAKGIVEAMGRVDLNAPIVIRLDGTNAEEGRQILVDAGIPSDKLISKPTMLEAAETAVALAGSN